MSSICSFDHEIMQLTDTVGIPCVYQTSQRNWVTIKMLYRYLRGCLLRWPIWASRSRYWLLTVEMSRSCLHSSRTRRVCTLNIWWHFGIIELCMLVTEGCLESRMRSQTSRGAPKWSGGKDLYIGKWYWGSGKVSGISCSVSGVTNGFRGSTKWTHHTPRGLHGP